MKIKLLRATTLIFVSLSLFSGCQWINALQKDKAAENGAQSPNRSRILSDLTQTTAVLQEYYVMEGKYPESLTDLKLDLHHPEDLAYDSKTGKLRSKTYPEL